MRHALGVTLLIALVLFACERVPPDEGTAQEHGAGEHGPSSDEARPPGARTVRLSAEAIARAGIVIASAERRAVFGGVAIPAEVQFEPTSTAHVGPLVPGRITKVAVALGDRVERGQLLGVVASSDVSEARARLDQAKARLSAAEATLRRQEQLNAEGIGAERLMIEAEARVSELRAEVEGLRRQLSVFGSGSAGELTLTAPIEGVVVAVHATLGETASPEEPAFIVTDPSRVAVRGNVPELEILHVASGMPAVVRLHALPDVAMTGTVTYVAPALEARTRSLPIRVTLSAPDPRLKSGLFGSIELLRGGAEEGVVAVPVDAVATLAGQSVVFTTAEDERTFRPTPIAIGRRSGELVEVRSGLDVGTRFAAGGAFTLKSALSSEQLSADHDH